MAKIVQTLIPILFLLATTARSQTTTFNYIFFGDKPTDLTYQGNAHFAQNNFLRLTDAQPNQIGRTLYSKEIEFWNSGGQVDFQTTVQFMITLGPNGLPAAGIAFFIAPVGSTIPVNSNGANLGIFVPDGPKNIFAVEFATYINGEASSPHVGINIGDATPVNKTAVGNAIIGQLVTAKISYLASTKKIQAIVTVGSNKFEVSYHHDLKNLLSGKVQVGLSAATEQQYVANHDIVSWYFFSNMNPDAGFQKCVM